MTCNVVLISAVQQSDSVIHTYMYLDMLFHVLFHYGLSQDTEYSSQYYTGFPGGASGREPACQFMRLKEI